MIEVWKDIPGYEGLYQISDNGIVKSLNYNKTGKEKILKQDITLIKHKGRIYKSHRITLYDKNKVKKRFLVHHLVYRSFIGNIPEGMEVDHIDNNPENNSVENLQLLTSSENKKKCFVDNPDLRRKVSEIVKKRFENNPDSKKNCGNGKRKKIKCLNNGIIYESMSEASKQLNLDKGNISAVIKGKRKQTKGYRFILV